MFGQQILTCYQEIMTCLFVPRAFSNALVIRVVQHVGHSRVVIEEEVIESMELPFFELRIRGPPSSSESTKELLGF
jgi:hypothetical protein